MAWNNNERERHLGGGSFFEHLPVAGTLVMNSEQAHCHSNIEGLLHGIPRC